MRRPSRLLGGPQSQECHVPEPHLWQSGVRQCSKHAQKQPQPGLLGLVGRRGLYTGQSVV